LVFGLNRNIEFYQFCSLSSIFLKFCEIRNNTKTCEETGVSKLLIIIFSCLVKQKLCRELLVLWNEGDMVKIGQILTFLCSFEVQ